MWEFWWVFVFICSFINWRVIGLIHGFLKLEGRKYNWPKNKLDEVVRLDGVTVYCKFLGNISSRIITGLRYKLSEVVQLRPSWKFGVDWQENVEGERWWVKAWRLFKTRFEWDEASLLQICYIPFVINWLRSWNMSELFLVVTSISPWIFV